jgi:hypothetical protein
MLGTGVGVGFLQWVFKFDNFVTQNNEKNPKLQNFLIIFLFGSLFYFTTDLDDFLLKKGLDTYFFHGIIEAIRREIFFSEIRRELGTGCVAGYALIIC